MLFEPIEVHVPSEYLVKVAAEGWELRDATRLRHSVFCDEQALFAEHDRDAVDEIATTLVAVACIAGQPDQVVGTVRIHEESPLVWYGSRLAVHRSFRRVHHIGTALIRLAVGTAQARGCKAFFAHVQSQNAPLFERLDWRTLHQLTMHGRPHHLMQADLMAYPPIHDRELGVVLAAGVHG